MCHLFCEADEYKITKLLGMQNFGAIDKSYVSILMHKKYIYLYGTYGHNKKIKGQQTYW